MPKLHATPEQAAAAGAAQSAAVASMRAAAKLELERRLANERGRYYVPNGKVEAFINTFDNMKIGDEGIKIFILRAGNGLGKSAVVTNLANYIGDKISNPYFDKVPYLREFPRPSRGRICTTANAAKATYTDEIPKWFSRGQYVAKKQGREFDSLFEFKRTGSVFDIFTFDQDPNSGESITLRWAIVDEPMPYRHFKGLKARFRFGGILIFVLTPLEDSAWVHDLLETQERLGVDVFVTQGSSEDACITHGIRGHLPHAALESMWLDFDEAELPARKDGTYLHLAGTIYKTYRDDETGHVWQTLPQYYQECWDRKLYTLYQVVDPHDRKPWAVGWHAVFPDGHIVTIAEWPDETMRPFHKISSYNWAAPQYAEMIQETERLLGKTADVRLIDPNFGPSAKGGGDSVLKQFMTAGLRQWKLPPDSVREGHTAVKKLLGDPAHGIAAWWHFLAHCKNHRYGMTHYGYRENRDERKGLSETPELIHKDFADLVRYPANYGIRYIKREIVGAAFAMPTPQRLGNGYVGA